MPKLLHYGTFVRTYPSLSLYIVCLNNYTHTYNICLSKASLLYQVECKDQSL